MSFSFNFASDEFEKEDRVEGDEQSGRDVEDSNGVPSKPVRGTAKQHSLEEMIATLPSKISYSRIDVVNRTNSTPTALYRRDLFDARFQMIHEDDDGDAEQPDDVRWRDAMAGAATDLVPGVYEGGLKTWECSLDLASVLSDRLAEQPDLLRGSKTVLELGCGTAVPSLFLFTKALQGGKSAADEQQSLTLQLCDFNEQVLRLVTVPNLILTWFFHSRESEASEGRQDDDEDDDNDEEGEENVLELNEDVIEEFRTALRERNITIELYSGHWNGLQGVHAFSTERRPDIILTSETIYSMETMPSLVDTLDEAMNGTLEDAVQRQIALDGQAEQRHSEALCLVAAKVLYFGVGGGVYAFEQELRRRRAHAETVWKSERGVARTVLQIRWR